MNLKIISVKHLNALQKVKNREDQSCLRPQNLEEK